MLTKILDEYRAPSTVAILERQMPNGDDWGAYVVKSFRRFSDEQTARAAFEEAKKIKRSRAREGRK